MPSETTREIMLYMARWGVPVEGLHVELSVPLVRSRHEINRAPERQMSDPFVLQRLDWRIVPRRTSQVKAVAR